MNHRYWIAATLFLLSSAAMADPWEDLVEQARTLRQELRLDEATKASEQALALARSEHGENHERTAISLLNLGDLLSVQDRPDEAETLITEGLAMAGNHLQEDDTAVSGAYVTLGYIHGERKEYDEALVDYRKALALRERAGGPRNRHLIRPLTGIGTALRNTARNQDAVDVQQRAVAIIERELSGQGDPLDDQRRFVLAYYLVTNLSNLTLSYVELDQKDLAEPAMAQIVDFLVAQPGPRDFLLLTVYTPWLAQLNLDLNRWDRAAEVYQLHLTLLDQDSAPMVAERSVALSHLAAMDFLLDRDHSAIARWNEMIELRVKLLGENHELVARGLRELAALQILAGLEQQARNSVARAEFLESAGAESTEVKAYGPAKRLLKEDLKERIEWLGSDYLELLESDGVDVDIITNTQLKLARFYAQGVDSSLASINYHQVYRKKSATVAHPYAPELLRLMEEIEAFHRRTGDDKVASTWQRMIEMAKKVNR